MAQYRRGADALAAASSGGGGGFRPFAPELYWKSDGDKKYVLILTPADGIGAFDLHEFVKIPTGNKERPFKYEAFMSRRDPMIEEEYDRLEDDLDHKARTRCMGVAVELIPVMKDVKGRKRVASFTVRTDTFTKKGDDGEEEVEHPVIGLITQSSKLMWSPLNGLDESQGPLIDLPLEITKVGEKADTTYQMVPLIDVPVDLSAVTELVEGVSYLRDDIETLQPKIDAADSDADKAQVIAEFLMDKRVEELADASRYEELLSGVDELDLAPYERASAKKGGSKKATPKKATRPSPRPKAEPEDEPVEATEDAEPEAEAPPAKGDRFASLKARVEGSK